MKKFLLIFLIIVTAHFSYSQLSYLAANAVNTTGTYTDLGATGTVIATANQDDANSAPQNIGFSFLFNGTNFTQFVLNTNGVIKLGAVGPTDPRMWDTRTALSGIETNLVYPMHLDLVGGTAPEYRVFTGGTAPNRVCTIQFKNVRDYFEAPVTDPQFTDMDFQVKLYETTNNIEFVYGTFVAGGATAAVTETEVGLKGLNTFSSVNATKSSLAAWSAATFINGDYTGNLHNIRKDMLPVAGTIYRFVFAPLPNNDAEVLNVYSLAKVPLGFGSPHVVTALVRNAGNNILTNLAASVNVTGANTLSSPQTVASLAPGATAIVTFPGYTNASIGTNTVTVSVAADDNNTNNSADISQEVTAGTYSYADDASSSSSVGYGTNSGLILARYSMSGTGYVSQVNIFISDEAANTGNTIYAVVLNAAGTIVGQSANYVITAADLDKYKSFTITTAPVLTDEVFYVGMAQTANANTAYFPLGTQTEIPTRTGAYYIVQSLAGGSAPSQITTVGRFMIEAVVTSTPLPVKLTSFSGRIENNTALLKWSTTYENNSDRFEIEKSVAGNELWQKIGTVAAAGNTTTTSNYNFMDGNLKNGKWMYRLRMVDRDGEFTHSPVVVLELLGNSSYVLQQNYPNPVTNVTMIRYELARDAIVTFELYSMDGRKIMAKQQGKQTRGSYNIPVDVESMGLASGKYIYRMLVQDYITGATSSVKKEMIVVK